MAYSRRLAKPLLVITVTDGEPTDSPQDKIVSVIKECKKKMEAKGLGSHAVAFQFAQVGGCGEPLETGWGTGRLSRRSGSANKVFKRSCVLISGLVKCSRREGAVIIWEEEL